MSKMRVAIGALGLSAAAFLGRMTAEGYKDEAYLPTPLDVPTIGFGTTGGVKMGDRIDPVTALQRAYADMQKFEGAVKQCVKVPLNQAEYDLYTNLTYNIGPGAFCGSTIVKRLNKQDYAGACQAILMWKYQKKFDCSTPGNKICYGMWTDRLNTYNQCLQAQP